MVSKFHTANQAEPALNSTFPAWKRASSPSRNRDTQKSPAWRFLIHETAVFPETRIQVFTVVELTIQTRWKKCYRTLRVCQELLCALGAKWTPVLMAAVQVQQEEQGRVQVFGATVPDSS